MRTSISRAAYAGLAMLVVACGDDAVDPTAPLVPTNVTVTQVSLTSVNVSWTASAGAQTYTVERASADAPGVFTQVGTGLTATEFDDTGLTAGLTYSYRVAASANGLTSEFSAVVSFATGQATATVSGNITANRTLFSDTVYVLSGYVKVQSGAVLTIEAGTRIVGDTAVFGSSLWILRGARLEANGTAAAPIVMTSQRAAGNRKPGDWGGLVIVGNAPINRTGTILTEGPPEVAENYGGGTNAADNSGTLRYVRIEFSGFDVSGGGNSELNAFSLYAVGSGTTLEYLQAVAGLDDHFEFWGGSADGRYLVSYEAGDDHFDYSEGYHGRQQFIIALQTTRLPPAAGTGVLSSDPQGFEIDGCSGSGCTLGFRSTPLNNPVVANFTFIGPPEEPVAGGGIGGVWRRGTAGVYHNGIMARWPRRAISVRDAVTDTLRQRDSLSIQNVLFAANAANYEAVGTNFGQETNFAGKNHNTAATLASIVTSVNTNALDWTPLGAALTGAGVVTLPAARTGSFFGGTMPNTTYYGAADPAAAKWWQGWTVYYAN
ncbi:MAG: fibronectin type III domain-containing protein [Gemmatimonadales bacterium]